jgi:hypothetical protein
MKLNEGMTDRVVRVILGTLLIALWPFGFTHGAFAIILAVIGVVLLATALTGFCPLYAVLGIKTCSVSKT